MIDNIRLSLQSIAAHKLRSLLTMLGVIIGIGAIIAIFSMINGNSEKLKQELAGGSVNASELVYKADERKTQNKKPQFIPAIPDELSQEIQKNKMVKNTSVSYEIEGSIYRNELSSKAKIIAVDPAYFDIYTRHKIIKGRGLLASDYKEKKPVVLLNKNTYAKLFPNDDGLNKIVEINKTPMQIVGVIEVEHSVLNFVDKSFIPIGLAPTVSEKLDNEPHVTVQTYQTETLQQAAAVAATMLNNYYPTSDYLFDNVNGKEYERQMKEISNSQMMLLGGIASISLLVGGIGVMNIMLVSVVERTREIGIKKALGAKKRIILQQFLIESVVLTTLGGAMGIIVGIAGGYLLTHFMGLKYVLSSISIFASLIFCLFIGIGFGLLPAMKAAKLKPIDALRYE